MDESEEQEGREWCRKDMMMKTKREGEDKRGNRKREGAVREGHDDEDKKRTGRQEGRTGRVRERCRKDMMMKTQR